MKNYIKIGLASLALVSMVSCIDTLDTHPKQSYDDGVVWGSKTAAMGFINNTIKNSCWQTFLGPNANTGWETKTPYLAKLTMWGGWDYFCDDTQINNTMDFGVNKFGVLRQCNLILQKVAESTILSEADKVELSAYGHLARGLVFFQQARTLGRFVPLCEVLTPEDTVKCNIPMTTSVAESYEYVISDLKAAADGLLESAPSGVPTKWAAKVLLSRAALQAYAYTQKPEYLELAKTEAESVISQSGISLTNSTGLHNETDKYNPEILWAYYIMPEDNPMSWYNEVCHVYPNLPPASQMGARDKRAFDAQGNLLPADQLEAMGVYLEPVFNNPAGNSFEFWGENEPTQNMVDLYLVTDEATGKAVPWYESSQFVNNVNILDGSTITSVGQVDYYERIDGYIRHMPSSEDFRNVNTHYPHFKLYATLKSSATRDISDLMYQGRDRRFYQSIVYDKATWLKEYFTMNFNGNAAIGVRDLENGGWLQTCSNYYLRKGTPEQPDGRAFAETKCDVHYNVARLAEAYLNLAECYLLMNDVQKAVETLNNTRTIHGGLAPSEASNLQEAWKDYMRERIVEMYNEAGDTYFSHLRWGKYGGPANEGREPGGIIAALEEPVYKVNITRDRKTVLIDQLTAGGNCMRRFSANKRYLLPIPKNFLDLRAAYGLDHVQNEGW